MIVFDFVADIRNTASILPILIHQVHCRREEIHLLRLRLQEEIHLVGL